MTQAGGEREPEVKETARARQGAMETPGACSGTAAGPGSAKLPQEREDGCGKGLESDGRAPQRCSQEPEGNAEAQGPRGVWRGVGTPYRSSAQGQSDGWSWQP